MAVVEGFVVDWDGHRASGEDIGDELLEELGIVCSFVGMVSSAISGVCAFTIGENFTHDYLPGTPLC